MREKFMSLFNEDYIIQDLVHTLDAPTYAVDIGASDGINQSNTLHLYQEGWDGLAIDGDISSYQKLVINYTRFPSVVTCFSHVTPYNIVETFGQYRVPQEFGFLNLDIDGYDNFVLLEILKTYRPYVICVEINTIIPPPVRFTICYTPNYKWCWDTEPHRFGQSISQVYNLAKSANYQIVEAEYNSVFLVPSERANNLLNLDDFTAYKHGYLDKSDRLIRYPWHTGVEILQTLPPYEICNILNNMFTPFDGEYLLSER